MQTQTIVIIAIIAVLLILFVWWVVTRSDGRSKSNALDFFGDVASDFGDFID